MREQPLIVAYNTIVEPPIMDSPVNLHNVNSNLQSRSIPHTLLYCVLPCTNELNCYQYISLHEWTVRCKLDILCTNIKMLRNSLSFRYFRIPHIDSKFCGMHEVTGKSCHITGYVIWSLGHLLVGETSTSVLQLKGSIIINYSGKTYSVCNSFTIFIVSDLWYY